MIFLEYSQLQYIFTFRFLLNRAFWLYWDDQFSRVPLFLFAQLFFSCYHSILIFNISLLHISSLCVCGSKHRLQRMHLSRWAFRFDSYQETHWTKILWNLRKFEICCVECFIIYCAIILNISNYFFRDFKRSDSLFFQYFYYYFFIPMNLSFNHCHLNQFLFIELHFDFIDNGKT